MGIFTKALAIAAAVSTLAISGVANASFVVDPNPGGEMLFLNKAMDTTDSSGTVRHGNTVLDTVAIHVTGPSDFANGFADIKPVKGGTLTDLIFTPSNPNLFNSFSFRGTNTNNPQTIDVIVTDNQGGAPQTIPFTIAANGDFGRVGIISLDGETIKSVELSNSGGFEMARQFEFDVAPGIPEPATWAMLILGLALTGAAARRRRDVLALEA